MKKNKSARCADKTGSCKKLIKDHEKIIKIQEKIIKTREHTFKIYERALKVISSKSIMKLESMEQEMELAYKDRNEAIRRYNAVHQLGEMAEGMGIDLTKKLPENEKAKWDFKVEAKVLESGKTDYSASAKKKVSQQQRDFPRLYKRGKKRS